MKIPKAFGPKIELSAFKVGDRPARGLTRYSVPVDEAAFFPVTATMMNKLEADGQPSKWWLELSDEAKAEYVAEHPGSKYADFHAKEQHEKTKPPTEPKDTRPKPSGSPQLRNHDGGVQRPHHAPPPSHQRHNTGHGQPKQHTKPANPPHEVAKPGLKDFSHPDMKPGSSKRKAIGNFLRKKRDDIVSHVKHEGKEWKQAGLALKKIATGGGLDHSDKKALGSVAADLAAVTASLVVGGGAVHGIAAFLHHFGSHLAQEMLIKAAVKGAAGHAHHASVVTTASEEDQILQDAVKMMIEALENGDLEAMMKEFEAKAKNEPKHEGKPPQHASRGLTASSKQVEAGLDMGPEVAGRGLCPECKTQMQIAMVGDTPTWACRADRISIPLPDEHEFYSNQGQGLLDQGSSSGRQPQGQDDNWKEKYNF